MTAGLKVVVGLGAVFALLLAAATAFAATAVLAGGVATVAVRGPDSPDLTIAVPGVLITAAAATGGWLAEPALEAGLDGAGGEVALATGVLVASLETLERAPDATLIDVVDGEDRVTVVKRGRVLRLRVRDGGGGSSVEISLPLATARRATAHLLG